jgi:hypothetical protein
MVPASFTRLLGGADSAEFSLEARDRIFYLLRCSHVLFRLPVSILSTSQSYYSQPSPYFGCLIRHGIGSPWQCISVYTGYCLRM